MKPTALVCDVDNTICNTRPRVKRCLEVMGRPEVFEQSPQTYGGFKEMLSPEEVNQFFQIFLSNQFLDVDIPLPNSAEVLHQWANDHHLVYLTGRHDVQGDSMREGTEAWLKAHDYPLPGQDQIQLWMKPSRYEVDLDYKNNALDTLSKQYQLCAGLGDLPHEGPMYAAFGLKPIIMSTVGMFPEEELRATHADVTVTAEWAQVTDILASACRSP